ncbi:MAG TPA: cytochrome c3 family protein [Blastocatellia bacterium]|nr:cytochrome c3 family protein [Blastocatellia bacterium]
MRLKLAVLVAYGFGLLMPAALGAGPSPVPDQSEELQARVFRLDIRGDRGVVLFNHKTHEARINSDPNASYKAKVGAACVGCHHTMNSRGIPQLWKCSACHRSEGDPRNPRNRDFDEVWSERAFHDSCIGCHRASTKGPTTCGECHKPGS